jgi:N-methylhydantoinase B
VAGESAVVPYGLDEPLEMMVAAYGVAMPSSRGVNGGLPSKALSFRVHRGADALGAFAKGRMPIAAREFGEDIDWPHPKSAAVTVGLEDVFITSGPGGGGYGDPLDRDPVLVAADVTEGYVSPNLAEAIYGVVIAAGEVDGEATEERRAVMRGARIGSGPIAAPADQETAPGTVMLSESVEVTNGGDTICARCSTTLSDGNQNFKSGTVETSADIMALGLIWIDSSTFVDPEFDLRQLCCPKCGTLLETELVLSGDPILDDRELFLD